MLFIPLNPFPLTKPLFGFDGLVCIVGGLGVLLLLPSSASTYRLIRFKSRKLLTKESDRLDMVVELRVW